MQNATTHRVKLLRGFGMGITLKDNQIVLKNGTHFYEKDHEVETYFPSRFPYERIIVLEMAFYHKNHESFQSLTYDVIEPFRLIVEKTVYRLGNVKNKKLQIKKKHYYKHDKSGMILLYTELVQKFLEMLEVDFRKTREYVRRNGMKKENGLSNGTKIAIAKISIQNLSDFCIGKIDEFRIRMS